MTNQTEQARLHLHEQGYQTDNLWHVYDVTSRFNCTDEQAHEVLTKALQNEWVVEQIHFAIGLTAEAMGLGEKEEEQ